MSSDEDTGMQSERLQRWMRDYVLWAEIFPSPGNEGVGDDERRRAAELRRSTSLGRWLDNGFLLSGLAGFMPLSAFASGGCASLFGRCVRAENRSVNTTSDNQRVVFLFATIASMFKPDYTSNQFSTRSPGTCR